jgi:hypothetical protein
MIRKWMIMIIVLLILTPVIWRFLTISNDKWREFVLSDADPLNVPMRVCDRKAGCKSVITDPGRDRTLETAFEKLRASSKDGQCDLGLWKKAQWGRPVWKELNETEGSDRDQPDIIEIKPALCEALANGEWEFRELYDYGDNKMVAVWKKAKPDIGFCGKLVMHARRVAPDQPYEVTDWSTYARLYLGLKDLREITSTSPSPTP